MRSPPRIAREIAVEGMAPTLARADTGNGTGSTNLFFDPDDFFSPHPAGINFLMADGHVLFIKSSITGAAYGGLCSRNGGEIVSADAF